ncbi:hypothetical protein GCM10010254_48030 [Streptomyces chromofuscus]|nr:hypothetical protein GCM10010254_48030 [Streptomyces chromofuscus]
MDMQTWRDGRATAVEATETLRAALASLGIPESVWGTVRPVVTHRGTAYVHVGLVRADVAERMAEAMRARGGAQ